MGRSEKSGLFLRACDPRRLRRNYGVGLFTSGHILVIADTAWSQTSAVILAKLSTAKTSRAGCSGTKHAYPVRASSGIRVFKAAGGCHEETF
jgi:hypothetical protein